MKLTTVSRNAMCNAFVDLLNSGTIVFETSGDAEVATCTFASTAFGAASSGVATAETITDDTSATGGTVDHAVLVGAATTEFAELTCSVTGGGGDIQLTSTTIGAGDTVSITSLTMTMPSS